MFVHAKYCNYVDLESHFHSSGDHITETEQAEALAYLISWNSRCFPMRKFESTNTIGVCSIPGHVRTLYWHLQPNTKNKYSHLFVSIFQQQCTINFSPLEPKHSLTHTELRRLFYGSREKLSDKNARNRSGDNRDYRSQQSNTEKNINITVPDTSCDMYCE